MGKDLNVLSTTLFHPGILEGDGAVEDGLCAGLVIDGIGDEVAGAVELAGETGVHCGERGLDFSSDGFQGIRIDDG